ncbi:MAG: hypothetical protein WDN72_04075 [Alphaproteobacteria bacterium]
MKASSTTALLLAAFLLASCADEVPDPVSKTSRTGVSAASAHGMTSTSTTTSPQ